MYINKPLCFPFSSNLPDGVVDVPYGGTGCRTVSQIMSRFNAIDKNLVGAKNGIASYKNNKKIYNDQNDRTYIGTNLSYLSTTYKQEYMSLNQTVYFTIEHYSPNITYRLSCSAGDISQSGNKVTYTAPSTLKDGIIVYFNGKEYSYDLISSEIATPSITFPPEGEEDIPLVTTLTSSPYANQRVDMTDRYHTMSTWEIATDPDFTNVVKSLYDNTGYKTHFYVTDLPHNTVCYARVKYRNNNGLYSEWSTPVSFKTVKIELNKPTITSPTNETLGILPDTMKVSSTGYGITVSTSVSYPHDSTDWEIASDPYFNLLVKTSYNDVINRTNWIATGLTKSSTYYVRVRYRNNVLGPSEWSNTITFHTPEKINDNSGRDFYRHESGMGSVVVWKDKQGVTHNTLVLDAPYRKNLPWANPSNYSFHVNGLIAYSNAWYYYYSVTTSPHKVTDWSATNINDYIGSYITDEEHNKYSAYFEDVGTSRQNTDNMMAYAQCSSMEYAAGWCRSQRVNGLACDLPNIQTLTRIWCSIFILDELDPTPDGNKYLFTGKRSTNSYNWYFNNSADYAWASTEYNDSTAWIVGYSNGCPYYITKNYSYAVIPILEV